MIKTFSNANFGKKTATTTTTKTACKILTLWNKKFLQPGHLFTDLVIPMNNELSLW